MGLIFAQPWGFLALLAIPVVLLIHMLQRERRILPTSTLFLWQSLTPESTPGRRLERLLPSLPLLFQILAVLLLTWILAQPRWLRSDIEQRVVIVVDESASMRVFLADAATSLEPVLRRLDRQAQSTSWAILSSRTDRLALYQGDDSREALNALRALNPLLPTHDPAPALREAQRLAGANGIVLFLTDREPPPLPEGVGVYAFGEPFPRVGFTGLQVISPPGEEWSALVRNYSDSPQSRRWRWTSDVHSSPWTEISLPAGGSLILRGRFPPETDRLTLELDGEAAFALDQRLPLVRPQPRVIPLAWAPDAPEETFISTFLGSMTFWQRSDTGDPFSLRLMPEPASVSDFPPGPAVLWASPLTSPVPTRTGLWLTEPHPLTERLSFDGLILPARPGLSLSPLDEVLLWDGDQAMIARRGSGRPQILRWAFSPLDGNAARHPSVLLLLSRFIDQQRSYVPAYSRDNVETGQRLSLALPDPTQPFDLIEEERGYITTFPPHRASRLHAPLEPGFFTIRQGENVIFSGAAYFAETREADFRPAVSFQRDPPGEASRLTSLSRADFLIPLWLLALLGALLGHYYTSRNIS